MTSASPTALTPSVNPSAPFAASRPISVRSCPLSPLVASQYDSPLASLTSRARRARNSTTETSSTGGSVFGSATIVVTPPAAAAPPAVSIDSLCSAPGSRSWTRLSTRPGARHSPSAFTVSALHAVAERSPPTAVIRSPSTIRSPLASSPLAGSRSRGRRNSSRFTLVLGHLGRTVAEIAGQDLEAGHAHRDPHLDLGADQAAVDVVGDLAADLDPPVHRPRMHDQRVGLGGAQLVVVEPEEVKIFARRRHEGAVHALALQAQHHHDVDPGEPPGHVMEHLDTEPLDRRRQEGAGCDDPYPRAHGVEEGDVRARHPAVQNVAAH